MQHYASKGRPDPEDILQHIAKHSQGKLTVFLGAAAGVGKTYAMLEAAHKHLHEGVDVVIGCVETHGRKETANLVEGLPIIPCKTMAYRGANLLEMDLDAIIARKPELVLVDELAHSNIPGSRHTRRFQDVAELLHNGINVYTAINIQHIESLNDIVNQITGIAVKETVPDSIVEQANTVKLIDIPPEDLIQRLKDGKVYRLPQAKQALLHFFRPENLNGLRELALRFTANHVEKDCKERRREDTASQPWPIARRVMVCVGPSPFSAQLIRAAYRLAGGLLADWVAVHIELAHATPLSEKDREQLDKNMQLAAELGAKAITVVGDNITTEILEIARSHSISTIVIGKPRHSRLWEIFRGSIVDQLIRKSGEINVHVIRGEAEPEQVATVAVPAEPRSFLQYCGGLLTAAATGLSLLLKGKLGKSQQHMESTVAYIREKSTRALHLFSLEIATVQNLEAVVQVIAKRTAKALERDTKVLLPDSHGTLQVWAEQHMQLKLKRPPCLKARLPLSDLQEAAVAAWAYQYGQTAGKSTQTSPEAKYMYIPLKSPGKVVGVLAIRMDKHKLSPEERRVVDAGAGLAAIAIERAILANAQRLGAVMLRPASCNK